jgi:hypothetical protein
MGRYVSHHAIDPAGICRRGRGGILMLRMIGLVGVGASLLAMGSWGGVYSENMRYR